MKNGNEKVLKATIPSELHMRFKTKCVQNDWQIEDVLTALAEGWVGGGSDRIVKEWMTRNKK